MLKNTSWLLLGRVLSDGLSFLFYIVLARTFGESGMGDYAFAFALAALGGLGIDFGLRHLVTRRVARDTKLATHYWASLLMLQVVLTIAIGLALYLWAVIADYSNQLNFLLALAFISMALKTIGGTFVAFLEGVEAMDKSAISEVVARFAIVVCGFAFIAAGAQLQIVMISQVVGSGVYLGLALYWVRQNFGPLSFQMEFGFAKSTLLAALPFAGANLFYALYERADLIILHHFAGEAETGIYAVAIRFVTAPLVVSHLIGVAMYPRISRHSYDDVVRRDELFLSTLKYVAILGLVGGTLLATVGDDILLLLFGHRFASSGRMAQWMSLLFFVEFAKVPYWRLLYATNREKIQLLFQGMSTIAYLILNLLLIPIYGAYGAVWAAIISEVSEAVALHVVCARIVRAPYLSMAGRLLLMGGVGLAIGFLTSKVVPWPIVMGLIFAVLLSTSLVFGVFTVKDHRRLVSALNGLIVRPVSSSNG
jgi:O-antigen/teichoic acid export membrane protein